MWDSHGVPICRVIRFYLARLIIDSNRWLLISYKQWLDQAQVSLVISMEQMLRLGDGRRYCGQKKLVKLLMMVLVLILIRMIYISILLIIIFLLINLVQLTTAQPQINRRYYSWYLKPESKDSDTSKLQLLSALTQPHLPWQSWIRTCC